MDKDLPRRPHCNKIWYWHCSVCLKNYTRQGAHSKCYQKMCPICNQIFETIEAAQKHTKEKHERNYCKKCNKYIRPINKHRLEYCGQSFKS